MAWAIERLSAGDLTADDIRERYELRGEQTVEERMKAFRVFARSVDEVVVPYRQVSATLAEADVLADGGRRMVVRLFTTEAARIRGMSLMHAPDRDVTIRFATDGDADALAALERRCPVVAAGRSIHYDRRDYFAQNRLMGDSIVVVAEIDGEVVAVHCDAPHDVHIGGVRRDLVYRHHTRVDPRHRGRKLFPALNGFVSVPLMERGVAGNHSYMAAGNDQIAAILRGPQRDRLWGSTVGRLLFSTSAMAGAAHGRSATSDDAAHVATLLAATHDGWELAVPVTTERVVDRMGRSPQDYGWSDLTVTDDAVVGAWDCDLTVRLVAGERVEEQRWATVLDWGTTDPSGASLLRTMVGACESLADDGATHLALFASPSHPLFAALSARAVSVQTFHHYCSVPEPPGARGVHVDPIWF